MVDGWWLLMNADCRCPGSLNNYILIYTDYENRAK